MDLPTFSGTGTGPQGTGGIPPEEILQGLRGGERDLATASRQPEDSPAAQKILNAESNAMMGALGIVPPQAPSEATPASATPETPAPASAQTPQTGSQEAPLDERIKNIIQRYKGDPNELAKGLLNAKAAATRAQQDRSGEIGELRDQLANVNAQLAALLTPRPAQADTREYMQTPPASQPNQANGTDFWTNPQQAIAGIVQETVQQNLLAYDQARRTIQQQEAAAERVKTLEQQHAEDLERLKPRMARIYTQNRALYDGKDAALIYEDTFRRAAEQEQAELGQRLYRELQGLPPDTATNPAPTPGAAPVGAGTNRPPAAATPQVRDWSRTKEMDRLWKSKSETADEMGALTDVLKQRGHGEHIT